MSRMLKVLSRFVTLFVVFCVYVPVYAGPADGVVQFSTLASLLAGGYDGDVSVKQLLDYGDTGLGTFNGLDGEMVMVDGHVYKVSYSGKVTEQGMSAMTPFAVVTFFEPDSRLSLAPGTDYDGLKKRLDAVLPSSNMFYAIRIEGSFSRMKTRSVRKQTRPYPPLKEAVKGQSVFELHDVNGTIVGFVSPSYIGTVNVPGYHLHFVNSGRDAGGHVLAFTVMRADVEIDMKHDFHLYLPHDPLLPGHDTGQSSPGEIYQIEHGK